MRYIGYVDTYFEGKIDEVRIWDIVRTQTEIQENMGTSLTGNEDGLVAYYEFNEGSGFEVTDSSTSANDGTINGYPEWVESGSMAVGTLTVNIEIVDNADFSDIGAQWSVDESNWYDSGDTIYMVEGTYTITFSSINNYYDLSDEFVSIENNSDENISVTMVSSAIPSPLV
jgi:hypothetical protein